MKLKVCSCDKVGHEKWCGAYEGPQDTDPHAPHYFAPYDDMGNKRTINNAVDAGWSAVEK